MKRSTENTRPFGFKNTDNKAIAAAINYAVAYAIIKLADTQQNGFVCGREDLNNIIDIDARARISDMNATAINKNKNGNLWNTRKSAYSRRISYLTFALLPPALRISLYL